MKHNLILILFLLFNLGVFTQVKENSLVKTAEIKIDLSLFQKVSIKKNIFSSYKGITISQSNDLGIIISEPILVPLDSPEPFIAISAVWKAEQIEKTNILIHIQSSKDNNVWEEWENFLVDENVQPKREEYIGGLLYFPKEIKYFRFKIELKKIDNFAPIIKNIRFVFISPGATPKNVLDEIKKCEPKEKDSNNWSPFPGKEIIDQVDTSHSELKLFSFTQPVYVTRNNWQCPDGQNSPLWSPNYTTVTHLIIHHTDGANSSNDWPAVVRSIWTFHTKTNDWGDIGYNWLIDPDGVIYEGRAGGDNVIGAHFSCMNTNTMGIAALGTFTSISPSTKALTNLKNLLAWKCDQRSIDPLGSSYHSTSQLDLMNISGHRDGNTSSKGCSTTQCPGDNLYAQLPTIRTNVNNLFNQTIPVVITNSATIVTNSSAILNATITNDGGSNILERRFDWGTTPTGGGWSDWTSNVVVSGNDFSFSLTGLTSGTTYYFRAWANNSSGWSHNGILSFTTVSQSVIPTLIAPANNSHPTGSFSFQWNDVSNATNYKLWILLPGSSDWLNDVTTLTNYPFSPTKLGEFRWKVQAYVNGIWSDYSSEWVLYWDGLQSPTLVSPPHNSQIHVLKPIFQWDLVTGANYYELQLAKNNSFTDMVRDNLTIYGYSWQLDNQELADGLTYYWKVRSSNPIGQWSSVWNFQVVTNVTISGYVHTSNGSSINSVVMNGLPNNPNTDANGYYTGTVNYGWSGTVTPTKSSYTFSPTSHSYSNVTTNLSTDYIGTELVSVEQISQLIPDRFALLQNHPNPFNPSTIIRYDLPMEGLVTIKIYDLLGREVKTLVDEHKSAGSYSVEFDARNLTSGTYFYRLTSGDFTEIKKLILMK